MGALVIEKGSLSKPEVLKRRADARDRRTKKEQALAERAKDRKQEMDRDALRKQMALDETERTTVDDRKDSEKKLAEEDMYAKFARCRSRRHNSKTRRTGLLCGTFREPPSIGAERSGYPELCEPAANVSTRQYTCREKRVGGVRGRRPVFESADL